MIAFLIVPTIIFVLWYFAFLIKYIKAIRENYVHKGHHIFFGIITFYITIMIFTTVIKLIELQ